MSTDALAQLSQRLVTFTMILLIAVVLLNSIVLLIPAWSFSNEFYGITLSLTDQRLSALNVSLQTLPWWQAAGAGVEVAAGLCRLEAVDGGLFEMETARAGVVTQAAAQPDLADRHRRAAAGGHRQIELQVQAAAGRQGQARVADGQREQAAQRFLRARETAIQILLHVGRFHGQLPALDLRRGVGGGGDREAGDGGQQQDAKVHSVSAGRLGRWKAR